MPEKLIVGVDIRDLRIAKTGSRTYLEEIYKRFKTTDLDCQFVFFDTTIPVYTGKYKLLKLIEHIRFFFWKQVILPLKAKAANCDILFCTDYFLPYFAPGIKKVAVFYDAFFYEYPGHYNSLWLKIFKWIAVPAARRADRIITISEYSRNRISHFTGIPEEKITSIHLAPKEIATTPVDPGHKPEKIKSKFILHVGTLEKRKNLVRLIEAFDLLRRSGHADYSLILVGQPSPKEDMDDSTGITNIIQELDLKDHVFLTGFASDQDLAYFYKYAEMYVFPSINEGFGLPVLEAFHHGLPVLAADNTCLPEVGGDAILTFDPFRSEDIFLKMKAVAEDPVLRTRLAESGRERLKMFSWDKNASELVKIFKSLVKKN